MNKRALLSVGDTSGIVAFATGLISLGYELIASRETATVLAESGIAATLATDSGILLDDKSFVEVACINLDSSFSSGEDYLEKLDFLPAEWLRSAAKHSRDIVVITDPKIYTELLALLKQGKISETMRLDLAISAFYHTAAYDAEIASLLQKQSPTAQAYPERLTLTYQRVQTIRYGENPHQTAAFYRELTPPDSALCLAEQINGKELSYNNLSDAHTAVDILREFPLDTPCAVVVKHANPCGVGIGEALTDAFSRAHKGDPVSISGAIVALNQRVDVATAKLISNIFLEIVIAPDFEEEALAILSEKKSLRILRHPNCILQNPKNSLDTKSVVGGLLVQQLDTELFLDEELEVVTKRAPSEDEMRQLKLAMRVVKHVKSNAICLAKDDSVVGVGAGQTKRVTAVDTAVAIAGERAKGAVMASDAFITLPDCIVNAANAGIVAIIQPGGSVRDQESIDACNAAGIAMVFTGIRHFKH